MPSRMSWEKMLQYRKDYNLRYLEIMRNSGYAIAFKLHYDSDKPHHNRWYIEAYVNDRSVARMGVFGYSSAKRPPLRALRRTLHLLINTLLGKVLVRIHPREDNSSEKNQPSTPNARHASTPHVPQERASSSDNHARSKWKVPSRLQLQRARDSVCKKTKLYFG